MLAAHQAVTAVLLSREPTRFGRREHDSSTPVIFFFLFLSLFILIPVFVKLPLNQTPPKPASLCSNRLTCATNLVELGISRHTNMQMMKRFHLFSF